MAEDDASSQAGSHDQTKSYASGNDLFPFSAFWIILWKSGNTGAEKLSDRSHPIPDGVYPLCKPIEANSMKIYGATKAHRISTKNILAS
ncbi:MAG TPA: hypothetical protein VKB35_08970 [Ktedonobacteraceae bacterium]|nr:hypothetical protein [Ktedonobacteraceae bacterium]